MKLSLLLVLCTFLASNAWSQTGKISGLVKDAVSGETIPSASVMYGDGLGMMVDIDGNFSVELPYGEYNFIISSIGYDKKTILVKLNKLSFRLDVQLVPVELGEVIITSDYAVGRETPVAYSNIPMQRVEEELASRDIATLANTTPGAYATQQGGGDGDARVTIRGFSQNNIAVMLDGVPVNDMENGWVYWSNWFGLDVVMQTTQIQRGLGASKLAIPAVGGTMNMITRGIDQKRKIQLKQEVGNDMFLRTSLGISTGKINDRFGFTFAGSYKRGNGWVEGNWTRGFFYYGKAEAVFGKHLISISALGAPQSHGQRSTREAIALYDGKYANELGIDTSITNDIPDRGIGYNSNVGELQRYDFVNGEKTNLEEEELLNTRVNYFHKPQYSLKDVWRLTDESFLSTVLYVSSGNGGGTQPNAFPDALDYLDNGYLNLQHIYDVQSGYDFAVDPPPFVTQDPSIDPDISLTQHRAIENYLKSSINNHIWYGALSTYSRDVNDKLNLSAGLDYRWYKGEHYREIIDLLGADYAVVTQGYNQNDSRLIRTVHDTIDYNNDSFVQYGGLFVQTEYKGYRWSGFVSASTARTGYKRTDYFLPKILELGDTTLEIGYHLQNQGDTELAPDTVIYNGVEYSANHPDLKFQETNWYWRQGFTIKAGFNYNFNEFISGFINEGFFTKAPLFNQVFNFGNEKFEKIVNEKILASEFGLAFEKSKVTSHLNLYYTSWQNKPYPGFSVTDEQTGEPVSVNVQGMNARHMGAELDMALLLTRKITLEGIVSIGDWIWDSKDTVQVFRDDGTPVMDNNGTVTTSDDFVKEVTFDARGIHVGNAAQTQLGAMLRYEPTPNSYIKIRYTYFDRHWAEFNPFDLTGADAGRDSWKIPGYGIAELHAGHTFRFDRASLSLRGSILNALDTRFISDGENNSSFSIYNEKPSGNYRGFDAASSGVYFGQGRTFNLSMALIF